MYELRSAVEPDALPPVRLVPVLSIVMSDGLVSKELKSSSFIVTAP